MTQLRMAAKSFDCRFYGEIVGGDIPPVGTALRVLDYPTVTQYRVVRREDNGHGALFDPHERLTLILEAVEVTARSAHQGQPAGIRPATDLLARLERIGKLAKSYLNKTARLRISHSDFRALCETSGLSSDVAAYDGFAFDGIPMTVGEEGAEWNATTAFEGFNPDMCVLRVTLPGGQPFVMDGNLLDICKRLVAGTLDPAGATGEIFFHLRKREFTVTAAIERGIENLLACMVEGVLPPYDGAQELITLCLAPPSWEPDDDIGMTCAGLPSLASMQLQSH